MANQYLLPDHDAIIRERVEELGLNDFRSSILESAYSAYELVGTQQTTTTSIGTTRFGGDPDLPADFDAELIESCAFVYQVNFADLPNGPVLGLPTNGIFSLFSPYEPCDGGVTFFFPSSDLVRHQMPEPMENCIFSDVKPWNLSIANGVGFAAYGDELVDEIEEAGLEEPYESLCETEFNTQSGPRFGEILGRFADLNGDMRNDAAEDCGGEPTQWRSLWKVFSSYESNLVISDFHVLHGMIRDSDLERKDFTKLYSIQDNG